MMTLTLVLAMQAMPAPVVSEEEIVVRARKLRLIEVEIKAPKHHGALVLERCAVTKPTGYPELDAIPCEAARQCMGEGPATRRLLSACVDRTSQTKIDAVVERWRGGVNAHAHEEG